nr:unnamed protein product [Naegleria fowleri]
MSPHSKNSSWQQKKQQREQHDKDNDDSSSRFTSTTNTTTSTTVHSNHHPHHHRSRNTAGLGKQFIRMEAAAATAVENKDQQHLISSYPSFSFGSTTTTANHHSLVPIIHHDDVLDREGGVRTRLYHHNNRREDPYVHPPTVVPLEDEGRGEKEDSLHYNPCNTNNNQDHDDHEEERISEELLVRFSRPRAAVVAGTRRRRRMSSLIVDPHRVGGSSSSSSSWTNPSSNTSTCSFPFLMNTDNRPSTTECSFPFVMKEGSVVDHVPCPPQRRYSMDASMIMRMQGRFHGTPTQMNPFSPLYLYREETMDELLNGEHSEEHRHRVWNELRKLGNETCSPSGNSRRRRSSSSSSSIVHHPRQPPQEQQQQLAFVSSSTKTNSSSLQLDPRSNGVLVVDGGVEDDPPFPGASFSIRRNDSSSFVQFPSLLPLTVPNSLIQDIGNNEHPNKKKKEVASDLSWFPSSSSPTGFPPAQRSFIIHFENVRPAESTSSSAVSSSSRVSPSSSSTSPNHSSTSPCFGLTLHEVDVQKSHPRRKPKGYDHMVKHFTLNTQNPSKSKDQDSRK